MKFTRISLMLLCMISIFLTPVYGLSHNNDLGLVLEVSNIEVTSGQAYDLSNEANADLIRTMIDGSIVIEYTMTGTNQYQSLFSISNSTTGNRNRHFHLYVTPSGTLGMELRNTDSIFKYTLSAQSALKSGTKNVIAFKGDSTTGQYKLFANGTLVATLQKLDFKFFNDITGLSTVSLGGTIREGAVDYPFGGTIHNTKLYDEVLTDSQLEAMTRTTLVSESDISITAGSGYDISSELSEMTSLSDGTVIVEFTSTSNNAYQSLFSVSNGTTGNSDRHFHIYITPSGTLGFELRNTDSIFKYMSNRPSALRTLYIGENAVNTIAFKGDSNVGEYKLFANGELVTTLSVNDFKFFDDITDLTDVTLGGTVRGGTIAYPFGGTIHNVKVYNEVFTDSELEDITKGTTYGTKIFFDGDITNASCARIPSILTTNDGTMVSAIDARYGGTHDSKSNIDIAFSRSVDGGVSWSNPALPMVFVDYAAQRIDWPRDSVGKELRIQGSASFIDPSMVYDEEIDRLFLFADLMPAGIGSGNAVVGSGYKEINGTKYLKLHLYTDSSDAYNYTVRENGVIFDDLSNQPTSYTMNENYEISLNAIPLTVNQYEIRIENNILYEETTVKTVNMSVFYKDSIFTVLPTTYLAMRYSDDYGVSWSSMILLNKLKSDSEKLLITGPGVGIQIKNGVNQGRLVLPVYTITKAGFGVVYSDDNGASWTLSKGPDEGVAATAEAQVIELPDGSLKVYERTSSGKIAECTSLDGGETWQHRVLVNELPATSYGTQVSVINYSGLIDGRSAIILSAPNSTSARKDGRIRIGLITDTGLIGVDKYNIDWTYSFSVDGVDVGYSYSCLTELSNGKIGVLYEKYDSWSRSELHLKNVIYYEEYTIDQLKGL